jgi:hypothetical protein
MCRGAAVAAAQAHAREEDAELTRVDAASAGAMRRTRSGDIAPVEMGLVYTRDREHVVRQSVIECRVDQSGRVTLADLRAGQGSALLRQPNRGLRTTLRGVGQSRLVLASRSEPQGRSAPGRRPRSARHPPAQMLAMQTRSHPQAGRAKLRLAVASVRPPEVAAPRALTEPDAKHMLSRAQGLLQQGDISGARLVLERAAGRDDASAASLLARTYDPAQLRAWKVRGIRPDPDKARELYAKATADEPASTGSIE